MIKTAVRFVAFLLGLLYQMAIHRLLAPKSVFSGLAITSLMISGAALATPLWQQIIEVVISQRHEDAPLSPYFAGILFLVLTFLFAWLSHRLAPRVNAEKLVDMKVISPPISLASSRVYCYCGTVLTLSEAEVVVTSENTELNLGSLRGTSVSGRMRRAAARFNVDGTLIEDPLSDSVAQWRSAQGTNGPYALGVCFVSPPFNAVAQGIKAIVHAVALEKLGNGSNKVDAAAIRKVIIFTLEHCRENGFRSVFIPVFGIGSGGISVHETAILTIQPLLEYLNDSNYKLDVYLGTYRISDAALIGKYLLEARAEIQ